MSDADLAAKLANDISDGIDCGESRSALRIAVSYWANAASKEAVGRAAAESRLEVIQVAKRVMDAVMPPNAVRSTTEAAHD